MACLVLVAVVGAAAFWVAAVGAAPTQTATITLIRVGPDNDPGRWFASGAFAASGGLWEDGGKKFGGGKSPATFVLQEWTTQPGTMTGSGETGSFRIHWTAAENTDVAKDFCEILNGTGAFKGIHGTGTWTYTPDGNGGSTIVCNATVLVN